MANEKYQCLVDAVKESGVTLPPIKAGGDVTESIPRVAALPASAGPGRELTEFKYTGEDGSRVGITAHDIPANAGNPSKGWGLEDSANNFVSTARWQDSGQESETSSGFNKPKKGTAESVSEKILKCRDPLMF